MQRPILLAATATALLAAAPVQAANPQGVMEICRKPHLVTEFDRKPIEMPPGTLFADLTDSQGGMPTPSNYRMVRLMLVQPLVIPASARCASAAAAVTTNPGGFPIGPGEHRVYQLSGVFHGSMPELIGTTQTNFR